MKYKFIDLFAGIGGIRIALENLDMQCVFSSEWDEPCQKTYEANFGEKPYGDITKINAKDIPDHDILTGGFPCQPFSIIGERKGFADTRGTLFFDIERILKEKKPRAFLLENVKQLRGHDQGRTLKVILEHLKELGYNVHYDVFNGLDFGVPQKRERIVLVGFLEDVNFEFPTGPIGSTLSLSDVLEDDADVDPKHFLSPEVKKKVNDKVKKPFPVPSVWHENKSGNIGVHEYSCALRANASYNYLVVNGKRRLTPREMLRLQGFPDTFKIVVPDTQVRKQAGNSVVIPKIQAIGQQIQKALMEYDAAKGVVKQKVVMDKQTYPRLVQEGLPL